MELRLFGRNGKVYRVADKKQKELMTKVKGLAKIANNRLRKLEDANLTASSAYTHWQENGSRTFGSVTGNSYQSLQSEYWRIQNFLNSMTSTVDGAQKVLAELSANTGYKASTHEDFKRFFSVADKIRDYYKMTGDMAKALDYQRIWDSINTAVEHGMNIAGASELRDIENLLEVAGEIEKEKKVIASTPNNVSSASRARGIAGKIGRMLQGGLNTLKSAFKGLFRIK